MAGFDKNSWAVCLTIGFLVSGLININATPSVSTTDWAAMMFERLANHPATDEQLAQMVNLINANQIPQALAVATADPEFLNITVRAFCGEMSNRSELPDRDLNQFTATCMGIVRDDRPVTEFLTSNYIYALNPSVSSASPLAKDSINHYSVAQDPRSHWGLSVGALLYRIDGQVVPVSGNDSDQRMVPRPDPAGLLTTDTWQAEHTYAGTNRRAVEYTFREFLCKPIADMADAAAADHWVARDIDRAPGGSTQTYHSNCRACHGILDGLRGAFAYSNWIYGWVQITEPPVSDSAFPGGSDKYSRNSHVFPAGYVTTDNSWENLATSGSNAEYFGWRGPTSGRGMNQFGQMIAKSQAFSRCMVRRAIESVCLRPVEYEDLAAIVIPEGDALENDQYNLKRMLARVAANPACIDPNQVN